MTKDAKKINTQPDKIMVETVLQDRTLSPWPWPRNVAVMRLSLGMNTRNAGRTVLKRAIDILLSGVGLVLFAPLLIYLAIKIRRQMGSPVLFYQMRPGKDGRPFRMIKFRTMRDATDAQGQALEDAARLTPFGRYLRASSMDELPELWNVLKGDMSLVGPRPLLMDYLPLYTAAQFRRHEVRPGVTGWAQINGRNAISWEQKFALDIWYVDNRGVLLDLRILWLTIRQVIRRDGISADGEATMPRFTGAKE